ncbi:sensor histidine kinase [Streptomyces sp. NPDC006475]|uniref:sensor histidine kinase n=1 Tax=Streptomyces sp. NPDC006475 TaxID=3155719 RepID=UPI0033AC5EA8
MPPIPSVLVARITALVGLLYAAGSARCDRLGAIGRPVRLAVLVALWSWAVWVVPVLPAAGHAWLSVPLAALAATAIHCRAQQRQAQELASQQREAGRLEERTRIARELHDTLAQELVGSIMLLQAAERDWDRCPDTGRQQVRAVVTALGRHLAETRTIIKDLTPPALERDGLETVLRDLCVHTAETLSGFGAPHLVFRREHDPFPVPTDRALVLLRVTRGLLGNACEHAHASRIDVVLAYGGDATVTVTVRDDGRGFTPAATGSAGSGRGYGLAAAVERLRPLGGALTIDSAPGTGTCVTATLPVGRPAQDTPS